MEQQKNMKKTEKKKLRGVHRIYALSIFRIKNTRIWNFVGPENTVNEEKKS